jgi:hypothetical protein
MRLLAAFVLLLQLQPLAGSAMCFHDAEIAKAECAMPHDERPAEPTLAPVGAELPTGCASAGYCAPSAPAVIKFAHSFQITTVIHGAPALVDATMAPGDPPAPPFHPPKV